MNRDVTPLRFHMHNHPQRLLTIVFVFAVVPSVLAIAEESSSALLQTKLEAEGWAVARGKVNMKWLGVKVRVSPNTGGKRAGRIQDEITVIGRDWMKPNKGESNRQVVSKLVSLQAVVDLSCSFDDKSMASINLKSPLRYLLIPGSKLSDAGAKRLVEFSGLQYLDLAFCDITDDSIPTLSKLKYLQVLNVHRTKLTPEGRERLKLELPNCVFLDFDWHF